MQTIFKYSSINKEFHVYTTVKPSDVEPLMDMLLDRDQFDQDGLHHVQKTLTHYFSGQSADLWFSAEHLGLAGIAYCASEMMTNDV